MSASQQHQALIDRLGTSLVPVRRLLPPWLRTACWLLVVVLIGALLVMHFGLGGMLRRWHATPDLKWAGLGAVLTAAGAAWAAFNLSVPGRRRAWVWLALPGALLWIGASGMGCLRDLSGRVAPGTEVASLHQSLHCLVFIISFSIPLSLLMIVLIRRAFTLQPVATAFMIGLASAAASSALLEICHEFDAAGTDLLTHLLAVVLVIGINAAMGGRLLSRA